MSERPRARRVAYAVAVPAVAVPAAGLSVPLRSSLRGSVVAKAPFVTLNPVAEREAAHQRSRMVAASSSVAGGAASGREDHAARGQLEGSRPPAARLETMAEEWPRPVGGPSLDALREPAGP
jgi:hypothetical protein